MKLIILMFAMLFSAALYASQPDYEDYLLGAGDTVKVNVYNNDDFETETKISANGNILLPWIGEIKVAGLTTIQASHDIATQLSKKGFIIEPQVNMAVTVYDSKTFSVLGNVAKPGKYPLDRPLTLTDALSLAGGSLPTGSDIVTVMSSNDGAGSKHTYDLRDFFINGNQASNPKIFPKDVIYVPNYPVFYIYGQVQTPNAYKLERNMTVSQALATGGGLTLRATKRVIKIDRTNPDGSISKLEAKGSDLLHANDVLFVEESLF